MARRNERRTEGEKQSGMLFNKERDEGLFSVFSEKSASAVVRFRVDIQAASIAVEGPHGERNFSGTLTLTDKARCKLKIGDEALDEWQVLRRALEPLFFPAD